MSRPNPMRAASVVAIRRKRPGPAGAAYSHALAVVRRNSEATTIARAALRRGAASRLAVMAHARHGALERAGDFIPVASEDSLADDVKDIAWQLAGTRPAIERSIVDLELRYGWSPAVFARILGVSNGRALERSRAVAKEWAETLDPALMAFLGPGACEQLAELLAVPVDAERELGEEGSAVSTIGDLLAKGQVTAAHAVACDLCSERVTQMTSVRTLVGSQPLEQVPAAVVGTARQAKHRIAGPLPPSIEPRRLDPARLRAMLPYGVAALLGGAATLGVFSMLNHNGQSQEQRVAALVQAPPASPFLATPSVITSATGRVTLANNAVEPVRWSASTSAPWLAVEPSTGVIPANRSLSVKVTVRSATATDQGQVLRFRTETGAEQVVRFEPDGG